MPKLKKKEIKELAEAFPTGNAPLAVRKEVVEYQRGIKKKEHQKEVELARKARRKLRKNKKGAIVIGSKTEEFLEEFLRNGGNATQAALVVFNCSTMASAANIGSQYLKKAKSLARVYMERRGYGYGKLLDVAVDKMEKSKNPEWWDRMMKIAGYEDFITPVKSSSASSGGVSVNVFQAHKALSSEYVIDGEELTDADLSDEEETIELEEDENQL